MAIFFNRKRTLSKSPTFAIINKVAKPQTVESWQQSCYPRLQSLHKTKQQLKTQHNETKIRIPTAFPSECFVSLAITSNFLLSKHLAL